MKKYYFLLLLGGFWRPATAQHQEKKAFLLLDSIIQRDFQATFTYSSRSSQAQQGEISEGDITVQGNQYRLTMQEQETVNNGQTIWTYLIEANEVQITDYDPEQETTTPWEALANYRQDYTLDRLDTHQVDGQVYDVVALVATNDAYDAEKIILTIARTTRHIKRLEILDSSQVLHTFSMTNFTYNLKLDKAFFNFNLDNYQDIEIIDMR
jgi:outer membrane lipoprotein-sorting protein